MTTAWQRLQQANVPFKHDHKRTMILNAGFDQLVEIITRYRTTAERFFAQGAAQSARHLIDGADFYQESLSYLRADYLELARLRKGKQS